MKFKIVFLFIFFTTVISSQENMMFWNSKSLFNPAATAIDKNVYLALTGRVQWLGLDGSPRFGNAVLDYKLNNINSGIGFNYNYQKLAYTKIRSGNINYCYHLSLGNKVLSLGISVGYRQDKTDFSKLRSDLYFDPILENNLKHSYFDYNYGLFFKGSHLELGLSSTNSSLNEDSHAEASTNSSFWLYTSYNFYIGTNIGLCPNLMFSTNNHYHKISSSFGLILKLKERFWTGFTYKTLSDVRKYGALIGYDIAGIARLGYSSEYYSISGLRKYGDHELIVALMLK